jgi:hypothetical protein
MSESIVATRMARNLRYKLTYVKIFESYLESTTNQEVSYLLQDLIQAQHAAIAPLSSYLRRLEVNLQDLPLDDKLADHAESRKDLRSRLRFIYDGLERATSWYRMQLVDRQMTQDAELKGLLFELGEIDAAKLWRVQAVMDILKIPVQDKKKDWEKITQAEPAPEVGWQSRLAEDVGRPAWTGRRSSDWSRPPRGRSRDR